MKFRNPSEIQTKWIIQKPPLEIFPWNHRTPKTKGKILHHYSCQKNSNYNYPEILFLIYLISKPQMSAKALCWGSCGETHLLTYCWRDTKWYRMYGGNLAISNKIINAHGISPSECSCKKQPSKMHLQKL